MQFRRRFLLGLSLAAACATLPARAADDPATIRHVLMQAFDKPEARLSVEPVVVVGQHAVAGWAQGERGGRALLYRHGTAWQIAACAGDALKDSKGLREAGVGPADAETLGKALGEAEAKLPAGLRARFASFDGFVRMDTSGQHPPQHKH